GRRRRGAAGIVGFQSGQPDAGFVVGKRGAVGKPQFRQPRKARQQLRHFLADRRQRVLVVGTQRRQRVGRQPLAAEPERRAGQALLQLRQQRGKLAVFILGFKIFAPLGGGRRELR